MFGENIFQQGDYKKAGPRAFLNKGLQDGTKNLSTITILN